MALYLGNPNTHTMAGGLFIRPLVKSLGTKNFYASSTVDQMPKMIACGHLYGHPMRIPVPDIDHTDLFVVFGANPFVSNGSLMTAPDMPGRVRALQKRGGKMIVIDPAKTKTALAADHHLFIRPGTDAFMLLAIVNVLFAEKRVSPGHLADFINDGDIDTLEKAVSAWTPEAAADICLVPAAEIRELAREIASSGKCAVYGRMGTSTVIHGGLSSWLIEVINILTGNMDRSGGTAFERPAHVPDGSIPKRGFATIICHGHYDFFFHGLSVGNYGAYSPPVLEKGTGEKDKWEILAHLTLIAKGMGAEAEPGQVAQGILHELASGVIKFLGGSEKAGVTEQTLVGMLSGKTDPERILDFLLRIGPYGDNFGLNPDGINFDKLCEHTHGMDLGPLQSWIKKAIATPDNKIHLFPLPYRDTTDRLEAPPGHPESGERRFYLIGRRHLRTNNSWMHNIPSLSANNPCTLHIHPENARAVGVENNDMANLTSDAGTISVPIEITDAIMPGVVSLPHGWGHDMPGSQLRVAGKNPGVNANRITPAVMDPLSATAVLNGIPVSVAKSG